jgi:hypothetical protein
VGVPRPLSLLITSLRGGVFGYSRVGTSRTDTSSEGSEMAPQYDHDQESHHLAAQLRVSETMIRAATKRIDEMHEVMETTVGEHQWHRVAQMEGFGLLLEHGILHLESLAFRSACIELHFLFSLWRHLLY